MLPLLKVPVSDRFTAGNRALVCGFVCLLAFLLSASEVVAGDFSSENRNRYRDKFLQIAKDLKIPESEISFSFRVPGVGRVSHREDTLRIPASTMKLVVTAAAWELLGPDFELKTDLLIDGPVSNGVLEGNLIVVGRGDPAVVGREDEEDVLWELRPWCQQLKRFGVTAVKGKVLADIRYFSGPGFHPDWPRQSAHQWYYAASGALNLNDNCLDLFLGPVSEGEVDFSVRPLQPLAKFSNRLKMVKDSKKHLIRIDRKFDEWSVVISGAFFQGSQKQKFHVTVPDPAENFVSAFTNLLSTEGVSIAGESIDLGESGQVLATISHSLKSRSAVLLKNSQNLYADSIFRVLGKELGGEGSFVAAKASLMNWALQNFSNSDPLVFQDGSGLSRQNRLTSQFLLDVVDRVIVQDWGADFTEQLAVGGVDGTLRKRLGQSGLKGRVFAKTGTLTGVSSLAGLLFPQDSSEPVTFAMICNRKKGSAAVARKWQDRVLQWVESQLGGN